MPHILSPCRDCGEPTHGTYCDHCRPQYINRQRPNKPQPQRIGYDYTWRKLSQRARSRQNWCSDCGSTEDLTADHSPEAWARKQRGLPIRLRDIDVVCRRCNTDRGAARGPSLGPGHADPGGIPTATATASRLGEAKSQSHMTTITIREGVDDESRPEESNHG